MQNPQSAPEFKKRSSACAGLSVLVLLISLISACAPTPKSIPLGVDQLTPSDHQCLNRLLEPAQSQLGGLGSVELKLRQRGRAVKMRGRLALSMPNRLYAELDGLGIPAVALNIHDDHLTLFYVHERRSYEGSVANGLERFLGAPLDLKAIGRLLKGKPPQLQAFQVVALARRGQELEVGLTVPASGSAQLRVLRFSRTTCRGVEARNFLGQSERIHFHRRKPSASVSGFDLYRGDDLFSLRLKDFDTSKVPASDVFHLDLPEDVQRSSVDDL